MRVLQVMASGERGGGADHLFGLTDALGALGVECAVAVGDNGPTLKTFAERGVRTFSLHLMDSRLSVRGLLGLARVVRSWPCDLIHFHGTRAAFYGAFLSLKMPAVYTAHGLSFRQEGRPWAHGVFRMAEALICKRMQAIVSVSKTDLVALRDHAFWRGEGLHLPNAVDTERFRPDAMARQGLQVACGTDFGDRLVVGTVSRLVAQKSVADLIEACAGLEEVHLVIIGDGPQRQMLETKAKGRAVTFLGDRGDVPRLLPGLDVFALSSRWEGEPIALLEALACALPVVATATEGAQEILGELDAGILVPIGAPQAMADALASLSQAKTRRAMGVKGRQAMQERTYERSAKGLLTLYKSLVVGHLSAP